MKVSGLCILVFCSLLANAQPSAGKFKFQSLPISPSSNYSTANDIVQDSHGMLWIACNGLQRYDGYNFINVSQNQSEEYFNLRGRDINHLLWDSVGNRMLMTSRNYGLIYFSYTDGKIHSISKETYGGILRDMVLDHRQRLWVITAEKGIFQLVNEKFIHNRKLSAAIKTPSSIIAYGDKIIVGDVNRFHIIQEDSILDNVPLRDIGPSVAVNTRIVSMLIDRNENLWIGTERNGVFVYSLKEKKIIKTLLPFSTPLLTRIEKIIQDKQGLIWIVTKANGIVIINPETASLNHINQQYFKSGPTDEGICTTILEDRTGVIWIGGVGEVKKYDPLQLPFEHLVSVPEDEQSLSDNMIRGISEDNIGNVWISTEAGYINQYDRSSQKINRFKIIVPDETEHLTGYTLAQVSPTRYLITSSRGIVEFDYPSKKFKYYEPLRQISYGFPNRHMVLQRDTLWIASYSRLIVHSLKNKSTKVYTDFQFPDNIRQSNNITCVGKDHLNRIWIGTNSGISVFNSKQEKFTHLSLRPANNKDSSSVMMLSIESIGKQLWVSTFQHGVFVVDVNKDSWVINRQLTTQNGLPDNIVYGCLGDQKGFVWMSSNTGLFRYDPVTEKFAKFSVADGLQESEFNRLAFLKSRAGEFYFGGINGINVFVPEHINIPQPLLQPRIIQIKIISDPEARYQQTLFFPKEKTIPLPHSNNSIEFQFFTPVFHNASHHQIFYKLEGVDNDWKIGASNSVTYYNLPPGDYQFLVKAANEKGDEVIDGVTLAIAQPYWATWWFVVLCSLFIGALIVLFSAWRSRSIYLENKKLAILLSIKSREILDSKTELESLNQKKDLIFSILSHDLRSPLTTLKGFLGLLIDNNEMNREEIKRHATNIRHSVTNALDLIDNTLYWSLSQMGNITYSPGAVNMNELMEKIKGLYSLTAEKKQIQLELKCEDDLVLWVDENMIYVALRNLVSNALKFTSEGKRVTVLAQREGDYAHITVKDEGIGMTETERQRIISSDISFIKRGTSSEKGTGIGLSLCKKFIELNKGTLEILSTENKGSVFMVVLPVAVTQLNDSTPVPSA